MRLLAIAALAALVSACGTPDVMEATDAASVELDDAGPPVERLWSASVGSAGALNHGLGPALAEGRLLTASAAGRLLAFNPETGERLWRRSLERPLSGGPAGGEGLVVVGTRKGQVLAFDADGADALWESGVTSEVLAPAAIGQGTVVVRTNDGRVFALEPDSGERRWIYDRNVPSLSLRGHGSPVLVRGGTLVGFDNGRLAALELGDGTPAWEATIAVSSGRTDLERMVDIDGDPAVDGGDVFATSYQGRVAGLALRDGRIAWTRDVSSYVGPAVDEGNVYVADAQGRVWALDRLNGASVWRQDALDGVTLTAPRRIGDYLVVGASDGHLYWLSPNDGRVLGRLEVDDTRIVVPPLVDGRRLYVQSVGGALLALELTE